MSTSKTFVMQPKGVKPSPGASAISIEEAEAFDNKGVEAKMKRYVPIESLRPDKPICPAHEPPLSPLEWGFGESFITCRDSQT